MIWIHNNKEEQITGYGFPEEYEKLNELTLKDMLKIYLWLIIFVTVIILIGM